MDRAQGLGGRYLLELRDARMRREIYSSYGLTFPRIPGKQVRFFQ